MAARWEKCLQESEVMVMLKTGGGAILRWGGSTFAAHTLDYAMDIARKRTDPSITESGETGGRFNPITGYREEGFGIPAILVINIERYVPKRIDAKYCLRAVQINGPIELSDIVILFNHQEDHFPDFVDQAILAECQPYKTLKRRLEEAFRTVPFDNAGLNEYPPVFNEELNA